MGQEFSNEQLCKRLGSIEEKLNLIIANQNLVKDGNQTSLHSSQDEKNILNFYEAVEFLGISKSLLYKMTAKMLLPHYKPRGKMVYFDKKELEEWIRKGRIESIVTTLNEKRYEEKVEA